MKWLLAAVRAALPSSRRRWIGVGSLGEYPLESVRCVTVRGAVVAVFHSERGLQTIADVCAHMGASLSGGVLHDDGYVECPAHNMRFCLRTGTCPESPMYSGRIYPTRVRHGRVYIRA